MKKKGILLYYPADENWIGGVYYLKNVAFEISQSIYINENFNIYVLVDEKFKNDFINLPSSLKIKYLKGNKYRRKIIFLWTILCSNVKYVFPYHMKAKISGITNINWVPDFQHKYLVDMFSADEIKKRDENITKLINGNMPIVVSSMDCKNDLVKFFNVNIEKIFVLRFVSYIEKEINNISLQFESQVINKYKLNSKYICVANQFWKHKNHIIVFKAIELLKDKIDSNVKFVFTGNLKDYRNQEYIELIKNYFENENMSNHIINLGFLERKEQIVILKNAEFIIQPSLFEGWGTVLEDCKVLDKTVILSDIPIHREQKNEKCILFNPKDENELANIIKKELEKKHTSDLNYGIKNMYKNAKEYVKDFEKILINK